MSNDARYVTLDVDRFRDLVKASARRLESLPSFTAGVDRITDGRVSGCHLALSYLEECVVQSE